MNLNKNILKYSSYQKCKYVYKLLYSTGNIPKSDISKIRNIGISAHIDAGKTTTTERMLYYSGLIDHMGEVHDGNTVTDFMEQERERGITITSAAVTFFWKNHQFNLIDTPGHIDFTMEVEHALNVMDGVVVILDGSAGTSSKGVEAQTLTVWRQADRFSLPRIVYVNKMDRKDGDVHMCCASIEKKLDVPAVLLQLPAVKDGKLFGTVDVLSLELFNFGKGKGVTKVDLNEKDWPELYADAQQYRVKLIEQLSDLDDDLAGKVITSESFDNVCSSDVVKAIQKVTLNRTAVPVVLGSSYKNIGVQTLMDAVILYLPSPEARSQLFKSFENNFCGRAFKVKHSKQKGPLVFVRVFNGFAKKNQKVFSVQRQESEQANRLYVAYADDFKEADTVENGNIAVLSGLKKTMSGDLVTSSQSAFDKAKRNALKHLNKDDQEADSIFGLCASVPEPVFFCSIEPPSMATQQALDQALIQLQREDPSLRVSYNTETGQTVLGGMGELHLEIIHDRILKEYKIEADLGPLQIAYREMSLTKVTDSVKVDVKIGSHKNSVLVKMSLIPNEDCGTKDVLKFDKNPDSASCIAGIYHKHMQAIRHGLDVGLSRGPKVNCQIINTQVMLHWFEVGRGTSDTIISSAVTQLIQKLLNQSGTCVLEPVMLVEVITPPEHFSAVLADLTRRRSTINSIDIRGNSKVVNTTTPLAELMGYSTDLRTITSGTAIFSTEFLNYQKMSTIDEEEAVKSVRGF